MLVLGYRTGALGHTVTALIECCTEEGGNDFPSFFKGQHLHHYQPTTNLYIVKHPDIDVAKEQAQGNTVISSTSLSKFGRLLIILMGQKKYIGKLPEFNVPTNYSQSNGGYGEQVSMLGHALNDNVSATGSWLVDADYSLDILNFWNNPHQIIEFLHSCGLTPIPEKVILFAELVAETNQEYFDFVKNCATLATDVIEDRVYNIELSFFELAMTYAFLLDATGKKFNEIPLLKQAPVSTLDLIEIFKD